MHRLLVLHPHTLAQLYLDADAPTYEALCTTGVSPIHITRNDPHTSALTSASLCEHHDKSNGDGTVDAALTLLEEVQLCNIIPVLPRTFSTLSLVQQIIPCTAWNSPSSSFSSSALSFSARCAAHLTAAQREHTFRLMLRSDLLQPFSWELMTCRHSLPLLTPVQATKKQRVVTRLPCHGRLTPKQSSTMHNICIAARMPALPVWLGPITVVCAIIRRVMLRGVTDTTTRAVAAAPPTPPLLRARVMRVRGSD